MNQKLHQEPKKLIRFKQNLTTILQSKPQETNPNLRNKQQGQKWKILYKFQNPIFVKKKKRVFGKHYMTKVWGTPKYFLKCSTKKKAQ